LVCYRSDLRGLILPALGISDWKHDGIVELYRLGIIEQDKSILCIEENIFVNDLQRISRTLLGAFLEI
jgi:hypothetical protein